MFANLIGEMLDLLTHPHEAFPDVLVASLIGTVVVMVVHAGVALLGRRPSTARARWSIWETLIYLATLGCVAILGVTAFYTVILSGAMHGWWLFAHMCGAGALVGILPMLGIIWGQTNRFGTGSAPEGSDPPAPQFFWLPKFLFWLFLASGLVVVVTMLVSMLPVFGTDGLVYLLDIHRYSGLLAVVALALHCYCLVLQRTGLR